MYVFIDEIRKYILTFYQYRMYFLTFKNLHFVAIRLQKLHFNGFICISTNIFVISEMSNYISSVV